MVTSSTPSGVLTAILPCNNLDASERFYYRLGFKRSESYRPPPGEPDTYRLLSNGKGGHLHLTDAVEGWLVPARPHWRQAGKPDLLEGVLPAGRWEGNQLPEAGSQLEISAAGDLTDVG